VPEPLNCSAGFRLLRNVSDHSSSVSLPCPGIVLFRSLYSLFLFDLIVFRLFLLLQLFAFTQSCTVDCWMYDLEMAAPQHSKRRRRAEEQEEEDKSGTSHPSSLPPTPQPSSSSSSSQHSSLPRKPHFVTPLSPRKSNQHRVIHHHHHALPPRPSSSVQAASVKSYRLPQKPPPSTTSKTAPVKTELPCSLPPTPPATPAQTASRDTIGKITDIPTLLMILRTKEQHKPIRLLEHRSSKAVYPQYNESDW